MLARGSKHGTPIALALTPARSNPQLTLLTVLLSLPQLLLLLLTYRLPLVNPPLDAHGVPLPQDPETGAVLPLDAEGKPLWPEWLRGAMEHPSASSRKESKGREKAGREGSESESEGEGKGLLNRDEKAPAAPHELGKRDRSTRRSSGRRARR